MNIDLQALEQALAPLAEIGQDEITFPAGTTTVTLRVLTPAEERAVQSYASGVVPKGDDEEDGDPQAAQAFLDRFRTEVMAYAIVQVGDTDLRDVSAIPTGEKLDNGKDITIPKHKAMRDLIVRWTRPVIDSVFRKYGEAMDKVEQKAAKAIKFDPADLDTEIERLEARLEALKAEQEKRKNPPRPAFNEMMQMAAGASDESKREREEALETLRVTRRPQMESEAEVESLKEKEPPTREEELAAEHDIDTDAFGGRADRRPVKRQPLTPERGAPPPRIDEPSPQPPARKPEMSADPMSGIRSSLVDSDDMAAEAEAETQRILARRRRAAQGLPPAPSASMLDQVRTQRAPHMEAAAVERVEQTVQAGVGVAKAEQVGMVAHGDKAAPVFRMPAQALGAPPAAPQQAPPTRQPDGGSKNPRFRPPQQ